VTSYECRRKELNFDRKLRMKIGIDEHNRKYNLRKNKNRSDEKCEQIGT